MKRWKRALGVVLAGGMILTWVSVAASPFVPADPHADRRFLDDFGWSEESFLSRHSTLSFFAPDQPESPRSANEALACIRRNRRGPLDSVSYGPGIIWFCESWNVIEAGWPFAAAWGWTYSKEGGGVESIQEQGGLLTLREQPFDNTQVPFLPLWDGIALNTAFYGGILWLLWFGPGMIRRGLRRRRGLCVKCGYDKRESTPASACPECGTPV